MRQNTGSVPDGGPARHPLRRVHRHVFRLQKRMYRATQRGQVRTAHKLQQLLIKSWYARLLAVRRVTQDNRGKHTAGIDGVKRLTPTATVAPGHQAPPRWHSYLLRRTWIPKRGSPEQRPLSIPTQGDRARQTLVRQALEPEWEAKLAPHTYGFRPGRCCWDAIEAIFLRIRFRPQYALKVDIAKCFDRIGHTALLAKTQTPLVFGGKSKPGSTRGFSKRANSCPTTAGTPQGGSVHRC